MPHLKWTVSTNKKRAALSISVDYFFYFTFICRHSVLDYYYYYFLSIFVDFALDFLCNQPLVICVAVVVGANQ